MKRTIIGTLLAVASFAAYASCQSVAGEADNIATMRDYGTTAAQMKAVLATNHPDKSDRQWESAITDKVYSTKVKPWNAIELANTVCQPNRQAMIDDQGGLVVQNPRCPNGARKLGGGLYECVKTPEEIAANDAAAEKQREIAYRDSFNRIQSIPGICVGDACNHIKIQKWDAKTGAMLN